ncbi:hypothetical protein KSP40_PGU011391 [Platanthera guangdongensis]|uniref:Uncharacterized protein n=1 Tax=Platanthera guangdongensis TaxID=2320717 RepID=A0ABR2LQ63_9ASPA
MHPTKSKTIFSISSPLHPSRQSKPPALLINPNARRYPVAGTGSPYYLTMLRNFLLSAIVLSVSIPLAAPHGITAMRRREAVRLAPTSASLRITSQGPLLSMVTPMSGWRRWL